MVVRAIIAEKGDGRWMGHIMQYVTAAALPGHHVVLHHFTVRDLSFYSHLLPSTSPVTSGQTRKKKKKRGATERNGVPPNKEKNKHKIYEPRGNGSRAEVDTNLAALIYRPRFHFFFQFLGKTAVECHSLPVDLRPSGEATKSSWTRYLHVCRCRRALPGFFHFAFYFTDTHPFTSQCSDGDPRKSRRSSGRRGCM